VKKQRVYGLYFLRHIILNTQQHLVAEEHWSKGIKKCKRN